MPDESHDPVVTRVIETLRQGVASDAQVRSLVQGASQPMLILDHATRVLAVNDRAAALFDRDVEALTGKRFAALVHAPERGRVEARLTRALRTGQGPDDIDVRLDVRGGSARASLTFLPFRTREDERLALLVREASLDVEIDARVRKLTHDLAASEGALATSQEKLASTRKLTDLGELLSGVAHELKTPATYIDNIATLADQKLQRLVAAHPDLAAEIEPLRRDAEEIREGAARIRQLLVELQPLSRNQPTRRALVDLADLVRDAVRTFDATGGARTEVVLDLQSTHPVLVDKREMSRVVLNLLRNASEAMEGEGRIHVQTRNRDHPPQIRVRDEGPGVPPGLEAKLLQPFFTTKADGTGLGLVISKRVVEMNHGALRYERPAEGGACFVIEFERAPDSP